MFEVFCHLIRIIILTELPWTTPAYTVCTYLQSILALHQYVSLKLHWYLMQRGLVSLALPRRAVLSDGLTASGIWLGQPWCAVRSNQFLLEEGSRWNLLAIIGKNTHTDTHWHTFHIKNHRCKSFNHRANAYTHAHAHTSVEHIKLLRLWFSSHTHTHTRTTTDVSPAGWQVANKKVNCSVERADH